MLWICWDCLRAPLTVSLLPEMVIIPRVSLLTTSPSGLVRIRYPEMMEPSLRVNRRKGPRSSFVSAVMTGTSFGAVSTCLTGYLVVEEVWAHLYTHKRKEHMNSLRIMVSISFTMTDLDEKILTVCLIDRYRIPIRHIFILAVDKNFETSEWPHIQVTSIRPGRIRSSKVFLCGSPKIRF